MLQDWFRGRRVTSSLWPAKDTLSVSHLIARCQETELTEPQQADLLRKMNALGALHRLEALFNYPCTFYSKRDGVPLKAWAT